MINFDEELRMADFSRPELAHVLGLRLKTVENWRNCVPEYARAYVRLLFANKMLREKIIEIKENKHFCTEEAFLLELANHVGLKTIELIPREEWYRHLNFCSNSPTYYKVTYLTGKTLEIDFPNPLNKNKWEEAICMLMWKIAPSDR